MNQDDVLWDALAGMLMDYVDNYLLKKNGSGKFKLQPSYEVDYEISEDILSELEKTTKTGKIEDIWYLKIAGIRNINELNSTLQELILQFLPRFFKEHPYWKDIDCLKVRE